MSISQKTKRYTPFVDYIPAEVRENKTWEIVYYAIDPCSGNLTRARNRVKPLKNIRDRRKLAKNMVLQINKRLDRGWNPFIDEKNHKGFTRFKVVSRIFLERTQKQVNSNDKRQDTYRTYKSFINNIKIYLEEVDEEDIFCIKFTPDLVRDFIDYIYYDRDNSARTRNNYLNFVKTFSDWMILHGYLNLNPTQRIEPFPKTKKIRFVFPHEVRIEIFEYLKSKSSGYYVLCLLCYYCLIRRTELTKLKVRDVFLKNGTIYISSNVAKNKKSLPVTIPNAILHTLAQHIRKANSSDFLFSKNYLPGTNPINPKKISDEWRKIRTAMKLPTFYQWYSLKDTGITNLLRAGVPLIAVRDQARHQSSVQTDAYTPKEILKANESIRNAKI
ncbi:MAG: tyrosine-type recombinase/integrase [Saonia sp.]